MKYTCSVEINLPIERVVELWIDETNFEKWQGCFLESLRNKAKNG